MLSFVASKWRGGKRKRSEAGPTYIDEENEVKLWSTEFNKRTEQGLLDGSLSCLNEVKRCIQI